MFSLPALFLKEMCEVTNASLPNRCTYWASDRFYVSLCCCYTNRKECAYRTYKFPAEKKEGDPVIRACATGGYYPMKDFGGTREPNIANGSSVKEFVQERTSSQFCKWTYTWNTSNKTRLEDALRVDLDAAAAITKWMENCAEEDNSACCHPTSTLCPMDQVQATGPIGVECVCVDGDMCNKRHSYVDKELTRTFKKARPCETQTAYEHLLSLSDDYKKPSTNLTHGYMCNPLGERRTSYPDAELKKTISANLTAAKAEFHTCKNGSWLLDFESVSELVVDNSKLEHMFNGITNGTNDNITTAHCYVEVSFAYQQQYHFTFGAVSIDDRPLFDACLESESSQTCVQRNSAAHGEHQHFACCCGRHWNQPKDECRVFLLHQLKALINENAIAQKPQDIMTELKRDPLTKCFDAEKTHEGHAGTDINRPCARNEGCYSGAHARDVSTSTQHKKFGGCVSKDAPDAKKRADEASDEVEARFYRICRLRGNEGQCFAVLGTEDPELPDDVKGPQMVCCCKGQVATAQKCGSSHKMGAKIGDLV
ncbi:hypothetical protein AAVH_10985 [Aphelenchoides avenae]|nr:hypothetical protein AAVH_10985 [Aphelenchus avenae]